MSVLVRGDRIILEGRCGVEEAEDLLVALSGSPDAAVVLDAEKIHSALWQVLILKRPQIEGQATDSFVVQYVLPLIRLDPGAQGTLPRIG